MKWVDRKAPWELIANKKDFFGNPPEIMDNPTKEIINGKLHIKHRQFAGEELDAALKKFKA